MKKGGLHLYVDDMWEFFSESIATNMTTFQSVVSTGRETRVEPTRVSMMDLFAEEVLKCVERMSIYQVS